MPLKSVVETLDGMSDELKAFYSEKDGSFILNIDGVDALPEVAGLKKAYESEKTKRQEARTEVESLKVQIKDLPDDFTPEAWAKAKEGKTDEAAIEAAKVELRKTLEAERDEWKGKYEGEVTKGRELITETHLTDALSGAGVTEPAFIEAARGMLKPKVSYSDDGSPLFDSDMGPMTLKEYIPKWAAAEGKPFVTSAKGGGSKTTDKTAVNDGKNPLSAVQGFSELPVN